MCTTDGERWARELLAELRSKRFAPRAWRRFLARSFVRAGERRVERPRAHRQSLLLAGAGLGAWAGVALAGRAELAAVGGLWWILVALMLDWHLGMVERPDGSPLDGLGVANVLSLARAGVVPALPALSPPLLGVVLLAVGTTDLLDGRLARARGEVTRLGFWLDGAADGLVLGVGAVAATRADLVPGWVAGLAVARYALPWLAVAAIYFARAEAPSRDGHVSGRLPGLALLTGLALAALGAPGGAVLAAAGALGGLATFGATVARSLLMPPASPFAPATGTASRVRTPPRRRA